MKLLRLCAHQIRLNQPLPWNVLDEPGQLLLSKGFMMRDQAQIDALLKRGVYVDQGEYDEQQRHPTHVPATARPDPFALWASLLHRVGRVLHHPTDPQFAQELGAVSQTIQRAMQDDPDAGTFEVVHGEASNGYAVTHSLQTAFVASLVAERFGWSPHERQTLVHAALTMNIAMLDMQNVLARQTTPPTLKQRAAIETHGVRGRAMLEAAGITDADWLHTVEHHHVTQGGHALPADRSSLSELACMVHYADVYLAKMSPRATRAALAVNVAARELYVSAGGPHNPYVAALIKEMGIFPPGSFVKLRNGDTAIVLRRGKTADAPLVHSLIRQDGWHFPEPCPRDTAQAEYKVVAAMPRGQVMLRLNRQQLYGYAAA